MTTHRRLYRQSGCQKILPRQTKDLRQFLPSETPFDVELMTHLNRDLDGLLTKGTAPVCQKSNYVNVLDYVGTLATRLLNKDSILSSLESSVVDLSVRSATFAVSLLLSSSRFRYSRIRLATISIWASLKGLVR